MGRAAFQARVRIVFLLALVCRSCEAFLLSLPSLVRSCVLVGGTCSSAPASFSSMIAFWFCCLGAALIKVRVSYYHEEKNKSMYKKYVPVLLDAHGVYSKTNQRSLHSSVSQECQCYLSTCSLHRACSDCLCDEVSWSMLREEIIVDVKIEFI